MDEDLETAQREVCMRFQAAFLSCDLGLKVGISRNVREGVFPINGLRVQPSGSTCGWYIWAGETWSDDPDFFEPLHAMHLREWAPLTLQYLGLVPGWRFLITDGYEDVWHDSQLVLK